MLVGLHHSNVQGHTMDTNIIVTAIKCELNVRNNKTYEKRECFLEETTIAQLLHVSSSKHYTVHKPEKLIIR